MKRKRGKNRERLQSWDLKKKTNIKRKRRHKRQKHPIFYWINLNQIIALIVIHSQTVKKVQRKNRQKQIGSTWCPRKT